jgi:hypothetical protein
MNHLAAAAGSDFAQFDPGALVAAVNELRSLGKDGALGAVKRQLIDSEGTEDELQQGLFLVLRLLFEVPEDPGYHPPMLIGIPKNAQPADPRALPWFPLIVIDDIPLTLVTTFVLAGSPEPVEAHVEHFRRTGILRTAPLTIDANVTPAEILDRLIPVYRDAFGVEPKPGQIKMLERQLERIAKR